MRAAATRHLARTRHLAAGGTHEKPGSGFVAVMLLRLARDLVADPRFGGCAVDALRTAAKMRDVGSEVQSAAFVLYQARPVERMLRKIESEPSLHREPFRRRMIRDFESAIDMLVEAAKPSYKGELAKRAGAEATNWAGLTKAEKDANWASTFEKAVDAEDKRRAIAASLSLVTKLYPNRDAPVPDPEPETPGALVTTGG